MTEAPTTRPLPFTVSLTALRIPEQTVSSVPCQAVQVSGEAYISPTLSTMPTRVVICSTSLYAVTAVRSSVLTTVGVHSLPSLSAGTSARRLGSRRTSSGCQCSPSVRAGVSWDSSRVRNISTSQSTRTAAVTSATVQQTLPTFS